MWLLETAVLLAVAVLVSSQVAAVAAFVRFKTGIVIPARWWALLVWTCFVLAFVCRRLRSYLRYGDFWLRLVVFLMVHVAAFAVVFRAYPQWHTLWFIPIAVVEALLITGATEDAFYKRFR